MNKTFWELFSDDWRTNCLAWQHSDKSPVIPASGDTWKSVWTANPDILEYGGKKLLYYRGHGTMPGAQDANHDRIAVAEILGVTRDDIEVRHLNDAVPIVDVGEAGAFDDEHALDPATVAYCGSVLLYYSAVGSEPDSVGLAISHNTVNFRKFGKVLTGRAPDVVVKDGLIYMLFQKYVDDHYEMFLAKSFDGVKFEVIQEEPVLQPGESGQWDSFDICTSRLHAADDAFYVIYGGSSHLCDMPDYFGLARSTDLIHWERHPGNPIFGLGAKDEPDGGAIWFPALLEEGAFFAMLYEGTRSGAVTSQICQASIDK